MPRDQNKQRQGWYRNPTLNTKCYTKPRRRGRNYLCGGSRSQIGSVHRALRACSQNMALMPCRRCRCCRAFSIIEFIRPILFCRAAACRTRSHSRPEILGPPIPGDTRMRYRTRTPRPTFHRHPDRGCEADLQNIVVSHLPTTMTFIPDIKFSMPRTSLRARHATIFSRA